jgi:thiazole synthase
VLNLHVNGEPQQAPRGSTIADLLGLLRIDPVRVAVERNLDVIPKRAYTQTALEDGDEIEIVTFVGGG